jgi:predicted DCC family thiol-disulfide oxidoreductase YuxK
MKHPDFPISIFYDGSCSVCATEIEHYLRQDHENKLIALDISTQDFDPEVYHIPLAEFMYELHVIDRSGHIYRGVEAFWAIWQTFPTSTMYGFMGTMVTAPALNQLARLLYKGFAHIRPYLQAKHDCTNGTCKINKK